MGHGRSLQGSHQEEGDQTKEGGQKVNAKEHRRMRRRITNRESAHRMRMKRQEELETHQRQVRGPAPHASGLGQPASGMQGLAGSAHGCAKPARVLPAAPLG